GTYRGELYDIGFDRPEAHAIEKEGKLFYAFYADSYNGEVELRGLKSGSTYKLINYVTGIGLGKVEGPTARIDVQFDRHLLIKAVPAK
ncbi:MAG TPA: hypothetical protein VFG39_05230, partial [Balneolaceae bacterium]|nr:hypothetical protein [Balneolaceae bacterium]